MTETANRQATDYTYALSGNIFYRPRASAHQAAARLPQLPGFPIPHITPRTRRPQSIHILSYPAGYTPPDLRPEKLPKPSKKRKKAVSKDETSGKEVNGPPTKSRRVLEKILGPFKSNSGRNPSQAGPSTSILPIARSRTASILSLSRPQSTLAAPSSDSSQSSRSSMMVETRRPPMLSAALPGSNRNSMISTRSAKNVMSAVTEVPKPVVSGSGVACSIILAEPNVFLSGFEHDGLPRHSTANSTALLRGKLQLNVTKNVKLKSVTLKLCGRARTEWPEGIPPLKVDQFEESSLRTQVLTFFNAVHESWETEYGNQCTYSLRKTSEPGDNNSSSALAVLGSSVAAAPGLGASPSQSTLSLSINPRPSNNLSAREYKRLSLQSVQSRSFGKGESPSPMANTVQAKGFKVFYPGTYEYSFELPIDHHQLETTKLQFGSVKWELQTTVERAGAFKPTLHGVKEVSIVRVPDQLSLEMTEPISISRQWEDQLHYDIMISGKSFPIGTKIPIAFKLTPLAKVQVHKLKVFVTESVEYWTNDRKVTRKDPGRKILLLEKAAGKPLDKQYESSEVRVLRGGELSSEQRHEARLAAANRRSAEAARSHTAPQPLPDPTDNILGDLDLGLESYWGSTEIEMNVQIPTCEQMAKDKTIRLHPDCSWRNVNVFHWIKIVMRISRIDPDDPTGKRRRHFEISIDSPFTVLNCRSTQANTALPEYTGAEQPGYRQHSRCGCPDAEVLATNPSPASSTGTIPGVEPTVAPSETDSPGIAAPPAAHLQSHGTAGTQPVQRPMHLMRHPSFNPPAFDEEAPPPMLPVQTPPPLYDVVVGTPSVDGLADYFARLADYEEDSDSADEDFGHPSRIAERTGRVNVANPRTPGGRLAPSRSLELIRPPTLPMSLEIAGALQQRRG